jgi:hypothetical protein
MLTVAEAQAHERKLARLLAWQVLFVFLFVLASNLSGRAQYYLEGLSGILLIVQMVRGCAYVMTDLRLRGRSPLWVYFVGHPIGLALWLGWRRRYPIPTRNLPGRAP